MKMVMKKIILMIVLVTLSCLAENENIKDIRPGREGGISYTTARTVQTSDVMATNESNPDVMVTNSTQPREKVEISELVTETFVKEIDTDNIQTTKTPLPNSTNIFDIQKNVNVSREEITEGEKGKTSKPPGEIVPEKHVSGFVTVNGKPTYQGHVSTEEYVVSVSKYLTSIENKSVKSTMQAGPSLESRSLLGTVLITSTLMDEYSSLMPTETNQVDIKSKGSEERISTVLPSSTSVSPSSMDFTSVIQTEKGSVTVTPPLQSVFVSSSSVESLVQQTLPSTTYDSSTIGIMPNLSSSVIGTRVLIPTEITSSRKVGSSTSNTETSSLQSIFAAQTGVSTSIPVSTSSNTNTHLASVNVTEANVSTTLSISTKSPMASPDFVDISSDLQVSSEVSEVFPASTELPTVSPVSTEIPSTSSPGPSLKVPSPSITSMDSSAVIPEPTSSPSMTSTATVGTSAVESTSVIIKTSTATSTTPTNGISANPNFNETATTSTDKTQNNTEIDSKVTSLKPTTQKVSTDKKENVTPIAIVTKITKETETTHSSKGKPVVIITTTPYEQPTYTKPKDSKEETKKVSRIPVVVSSSSVAMETTRTKSPKPTPNIISTSTKKKGAITKSPGKEITPKTKPSQVTVSASNHVQTTVTSVTIMNTPLYISLTLSMTWSAFCYNRQEFRAVMAKIIEVQTSYKLTKNQVTILNTHHCQKLNLMFFRRASEIQVDFFLTDEQGKFSEIYTEKCYDILLNKRVRIIDGTSFKDKFVRFELKGEKRYEVASKYKTKRPMAPGVVVAIVISAVAGVCFVALIILQIVIKRRSRGKFMRAYHERHHSADAYSMESIQLTNASKFRLSDRPRSARRSSRRERDIKSGKVSRHSSARQSSRSLRSLGAYVNQALLSEKDIPSNAVNFAGLANLSNEPELLAAEFQLLPNTMPRLSDVPVGAEDKNRYANVIPNKETRVPLQPITGQANSDYINANYVKGYMGEHRYYIATQGPLEQTVTDFWRMIWEQQSRVIIMLTDFEEMGLAKCAPYWPNSDGGDTICTYGNFEVILKNKDVHQEYIISTLQLTNTERNVCREMIHILYTAWPYHGVPNSPWSVVNFVLEARKYIESTGRGPAVVHCSPGTGRTGTLIAIDIGMRAFEDSGTVDILNCVYKMRRDRSGLVQTVEQYLFIYKALNEYAMMLSNPSSSSSSSSIHRIGHTS